MTDYIFMHRIKAMILIGVFLIASGVPVGTASAETSFEPFLMDSWNTLLRAAPIYGDVRQGEVDQHSYFVSSSAQTLDVELTWNRASLGNDLSLTLYPPNQNPITINDQSDGNLNGKISSRISLPSGLTNKNWRFDVKGVSVTGLQSYTLIINAY